MPDKFVRIIFLFAGIFVMIINAIEGWNKFVFIKHAKLAEGVVVKLYDNTSKPIIRFVTADNQTIEYFQQGALSYVGAKVEVLYDAKAPETACINRFGTLWFENLIMSIFGAVGIVIGLVEPLYRRKTSAMEP